MTTRPTASTSTRIPGACELERLLRPYLTLVSTLSRVEEARLCLRRLSPRLAAQGTTVLRSRLDAPHTERSCTGCTFLSDGSQDNRAPLDQSDKEELGPPPCQPTYTTPLSFQGHRVGLLLLDGGTPEARRACEKLAKEIVQRISQLEVDNREHGDIGNCLDLIAASGTMSHLARFIEEASARPLPVLVLGEPGSETDEVARVIHLLDRMRDGPWVHLDCAATATEQFPSEMEQVLKNAQGGTLYLSRIHRLPAEAQAWLATTLHQRVNHWIVERGLTHEPQVRVIASAQLDRGSPLVDTGLDVHLLGELDFLRGRLEPLCQRREYIRPLASFFLHRLSGDSRTSFTEEAWRLLEEYSWPHNVLELRCLIGRLLALCHRRPIDVSNLLRHVPRLRGNNVRTIENNSPQPSANSLGAQLPPATWLQVQDCARGEDSMVGIGHEGLDRALEYIAKHSNDRLTVAAIARHSYLSSSHLSALFRRHLKLSPMAFVAAVRVERAKLAILASPYRSITEVASLAGFGDLRHFERTFKRWLSMTPRQLRDQARLARCEVSPPQRS